MPLEVVDKAQKNGGGMGIAIHGGQVNALCTLLGLSVEAAGSDGRLCKQQHAEKNGGSVIQRLHLACTYLLYAPGACYGVRGRLSGMLRSTRPWSTLPFGVTVTSLPCTLDLQKCLLLSSLSWNHFGATLLLSWGCTILGILLGQASYVNYTYVRGIAEATTET
jgi:hypothetical protein